VSREGEIIFALAVRSSVAYCEISFWRPSLFPPRKWLRHKLEKFGGAKEGGRPESLQDAKQQPDL
jgi:hypothetical protein